MSDALLAAIISGGCLVAATVLGAVMPKFTKHGRLAAEIRDQVANSHGTNLRDDLDHVRDLIKDVHEELMNLRTDTAWQRREQQDTNRRLERLEGGY